MLSVLKFYYVFVKNNYFLVGINYVYVVVLLNNVRFCWYVKVIVC